MEAGERLARGGHIPGGHPLPEAEAKTLRGPDPALEDDRKAAAERHAIMTDRREDLNAEIEALTARVKLKVAERNACTAWLDATEGDTQPPPPLDGRG